MNIPFLHPATPCCNYHANSEQPYPVFWNPYNGVVQCHNCGQVFEPKEPWKQRALQAEDLIERIRVWHEVLTHSERLEQIQSEVMRLRRTFPNFCIEMMPVCADDSWIFIGTRKPPRNVVVEVLFSNGEIEEQVFWNRASGNSPQVSKEIRPDCEVTHWREKKKEC